MSRITTDPLLGIARLILYFIVIVVAIAAIGVALGIPAVVVMHGRIASGIAAHGGSPGVTWLIPLLLALVVGLLAMVLQFFRHLMRIVDSVGEGDPFVPANAGRLTAMAWLMLAVQVAAIPVTALGAYIARQVGDTHGSVTVGSDFGGIVLILTLFILARVFRKDAEMRAELEGTV